MRISELSARTGVPIATVKFYIREGMLARGIASGPTRAEYGEEHVARLRLIAALTRTAGLPLARVRDVLASIDAPPDDPVAAIGRAIGALPPYVEDDGDLSRAQAAIEALGLTFDPRFTAVAQLESAIRALEAAGLPWDEATMRRYGDAMMRVAADEVAPVERMSTADAVEYAVLGTALYEPVMLALRRLAHQHRLVAGGA
ncbi:MAG TPA: MerR family transcriptional regulator [Microbacterium sp.]|nr:MerR family transcriptional regulator [Microbacterium sp.]